MPEIVDPELGWAGRYKHPARGACGLGREVQTTPRLNRSVALLSTILGEREEASPYSGCKGAPDPCGWAGTVSHPIGAPEAPEER